MALLPSAGPVAALPARHAEIRFGDFIGAVVVDTESIASDTRSTFIDSGGNTGYIDGMPKLFVQDDTAFAFRAQQCFGRTVQLLYREK
jgi:hypothetical protein